MKKKKYKISVIVAVYYAHDYLEQCIDSILLQTYENLELLLIDDESTDGSGAICDRYADQDERVRVIHQTNGGCTAASCAVIIFWRRNIRPFRQSVLPHPAFTKGKS